jgi:hypothetical protein
VILPFYGMPAAFICHFDIFYTSKDQPYPIYQMEYAQGKKHLGLQTLKEIFSRYGFLARVFLKEKLNI